MNNLTSADLQNSANLFMQHRTPNINNELASLLLGVTQNAQAQDGNYSNEHRQEFDSITSGLFKWFTEVKANEKEAMNKNIVLQHQLDSVMSYLYKQMEQVNSQNSSLRATNEELERQLAAEREKNASQANEQFMDMKASARKRLRVEHGDADKNKQIDDLRAEVASKDAQIHDLQSKSELLQKQVDAFDALFQMFIDKTQLALNNFFTDSNGLSESDNTLINEFINDLNKQKQQIMGGLGDTQLVQEKSEPMLVEDNPTEHDEQQYDQVFPTLTPFIFVTDEELLQDVKALSQSNDDDELGVHICKLQGLLCGEQVKHRLFEAKSMNVEKSQLVDISRPLIKFAEDTIAKSKKNTANPRPELDNLQRELCKLYAELQSERILTKELECKISSGDKKRLLSMLSNQICNAERKLYKHAREIQKSKEESKQSAALKLLYTNIGLRLTDRTNMNGIESILECISRCYKILGFRWKVVLCCTELIKFKPEVSRYYFERTLAYYSLHEYESALLDVNQVLELDPNNDGAQKLKEKILSKLDS